jgi:hypothetical protein
MARGGTRTSAKNIEAKERQRKALELRKLGCGYQEIADKLGYASTSSSHKAVKLALKELTREPAEEVLKLELERLDVATRAIAKQVRDGHLGAIDRWLRIIESRAKFLGLHAPKESDVLMALKVLAENGILPPQVAEVAVGEMARVKDAIAAALEASSKGDGDAPPA